MSGVFINYRVVDQPLGAAGIHEALVSRFGADNVFRDCVSMNAGTFYPTAIRTALANADVVVSVIGPRWLALRDEATGERLIDRDHDWVRRELAMAMERGIHVIPVLLKDTPEDARLPSPSELPANIRPLALLQSLPISQRRFGEDLDRLAGAVVQLIPSLGRSAAGNGHASTAVPPLEQNAFFEVVDAIEAVPCMVNAQSRALIVDRLRPAIAGAIQYHPQRRAHVVCILQTCMNYDGGVHELLALIRDMEQDGSRALQHLLAIVDRLLPGDDL
jgi:hypothetical protein